MSGGDGLFEVDTAAVVEPQTAPTVPVKKTFRVFGPRSDDVAAAVAG